MKRTLYRIRLKVMEQGKLYEGTRVVEVPIPEYLKKLYRDFPDAASIYVELLNEFEQEDESATARESVIIVCFGQGC